MRYHINLKAKGALAFRAGRNTTQSDTLPYIPGTSLIGALAQAHRTLGRSSTEFEQFFLHNQVYCGNCYPAGFAEQLSLGSAEYPVLPLPVTARTSKRQPGFAYRAAEERKARSGITDACIPLLLYALSKNERADLLTPLEAHSETGEPLDRPKQWSFFRRGSTKEAYGMADVPRAIRTRTAIHYSSGTAQTGLLYSRQVLQPETPFWGSWFIADAIADDFEEFVDDAQKDGLIRVGNNRTRGFGQVQFEMMPLDDEDDEAGTMDILSQHIETFTQHVKQAAAAANMRAEAALYVPLLLTSDAVLLDDALRSRLRLSAADLEAVGIADAELVFHAASKRHVASWSTVWGLPRADDWAIAMGSVFVFALSQADPQICAALLRLQQQGIGVRQAEGFGMLTVAHPFHNELARGTFR
jgi:CRISPR-associated Csx10 family RAMP protein